MCNTKEIYIGNDYGLFIKNSVLGTSVKDFLKIFQRGGVNKQKFNKLINDSTSCFVPDQSLKTTNSVFCEVDTNGDNKIDVKEIRQYFKNNYNINIDLLVKNNCSMEDIVNLIINHYRW